MMDRIAARPLEHATRRETLYLLSTIPAGIAAVTVWSVGLSIGLAAAITVIGLPITLAILIDATMTRALLLPSAASI